MREIANPGENAQISRQPWPEAMRAMTGEDRLDASAMVEYFQPLMTWLKEQNKGEKSGWTVAADPLKAR